MEDMHRAIYEEMAQSYYALSEPLSPNLHLFTNLEALQTSPFGFL